MNDLKMLEFGLSNMNKLNKSLKNISVSNISIVNNTTLLVEYVTLKDDSIDIKKEVFEIMSFSSSFIDDLSIEMFVVKAFNIKEDEVLYVLTKAHTLKQAVQNSDAIEWLKGSIIQDNTQAYRLSIAKRNISEIENGLRFLINDRLSNKFGDNWFIDSLGRKIIEDAQSAYFNQLGEETTDGSVLINYTYTLQLKKIMCSHWPYFRDLFNNKIAFEESLKRLNVLRREEAHNRRINRLMLDELTVLYDYFLSRISTAYPNIIPTILVDNWKTKLKELFFEEFKETHSELEIISESNYDKKKDMIVENISDQVNYWNTRISQIKSIVVPVQKLQLHEELLDVIEKYRDAMVNLGQSKTVEEAEMAQKLVNARSLSLRAFTNKYVLSES